MPIYDDDHLTTSFNTSELEKDTSVMNDLKTYQTFAGTKITNDFNLSYSLMELALCTLMRSTSYSFSSTQVMNNESITR